LLREVLQAQSLQERCIAELNVSRGERGSPDERLRESAGLGNHPIQVVAVVEETVLEPILASLGGGGLHEIGLL
jgi:hypothetical protein